MHVVNVDRLVIDLFYKTMVVVTKGLTTFNL